MLYHGAQRVKLPNLSKISRLLSPLTIFLRFQAFQRYVKSDVVFWWKVYRCLGRGLPLTLPNVRQVNGRDQRLRPDLDRGVLPGQQVMVRCRNSV